MNAEDLFLKKRLPPTFYHEERRQKNMVYELIQLFS